MSERMTIEQYRKLPAPQKGHQSETDVKRAVKAYLEAFGWFVYHNLQGIGCYRGLADLVAIRRGRHVYVECKSYRGRQSDWQRDFQTKLEAAGGEYRLVRDLADIEDLRALEE
jgi:hypothetical protein